MHPSLPSLNPIPEDIEAHILRLLHSPGHPETGGWLVELVKSSGHLSSPDELRWRSLCLVWLAFEFDTEAAWPYLNWLNMGEAAISSHLSEILIEGIDAFEAHVKMANWLAHNRDERLAAFFDDFSPIPAQRKMKPLISRLMAYPTHPDIGIWLAGFCRGTAHSRSPAMRRWQLLAGVWYASAFNAEDGLSYLKTVTDNAETLSPEDNKLLMQAAAETNALTPMVQLIADCPDEAVKQLLKDFGHPDLSEVVADILQSQPNYDHLNESEAQAGLDVAAFKRILACLQDAGLAPKSTHILDLACGPLAPQTLLLNSVGYKTVGVDLHIPPNYLPVSGAKQWLKRRQHAKAWQAETGGYYKVLAQESDTKLNWRKAKIRLADLTRLALSENSFDAVICIAYLQHALDVNGLLAEAARVLKPGGLFIADIQPYAGLNGAFHSDSREPWRHLRNKAFEASVPLNKWREAQFQEAINNHFTLEQWVPEPDPQAQAQLTPELQAQLADYSEAELTRKQIMVIARRKP